MAQTASTMRLPLGAKAPAFELPDPSGRAWSSADFDGAPALLVMFICNHCPYVKHVRDGLAAAAARVPGSGRGRRGDQLQRRGPIPTTAASRWRTRSNGAGYTFPYLFDETQEVAKAYRAACTPDFFLFDREQRLVYRGQMDDSRPGNGVPVTGKDLRAALDAVLAGRAAPADQKPSIGCNIKWKPGNEPEYFAR